jgi:hypothetical protein
MRRRSQEHGTCLATTRPRVVSRASNSVIVREKEEEEEEEEARPCLKRTGL